MNNSQNDIDKQRGADPTANEASKQDVRLFAEGVITVGLLCMALMLTVAFFVWSSVSFDSPISRYDQSDAGKVLDVTYLHGFGTRTQIKTTMDVYLVTHVARIHVGDVVVLQTNEYAQRLCIKSTEHCWMVVNR